jgi:hypothetical protein
MPEAPAELHVCACTTDGLVRYTIRSSTTWTPWEIPLGIAGLASLDGQAVDVACTRCVRFPGTPGVAEGIYLMIAFSTVPPKLLFRSPGGAWREEQAPDFPPSRRVAAAFQAGSRTPLYTAALVDPGVPFAAVQEQSATTASIPTEVEWTAGDRGTMRSADMHGLPPLETKQPVFLITAADDGHAYISFSTDSKWRLYAPIEEKLPGAGIPPGDVIGVAAAASAYGIVTGDGRVWATTPISDRQWSQWTDLELRILPSPPTVVDVGTFATIAMASTDEGTHVLGTTTDGRLWHQLRNNPTAIFRDVELFGVHEDIGLVRAVAAA